jgi:iron complex transport system substrate-binding protein
MAQFDHECGRKALAMVLRSLAAGVVFTGMVFPADAGSSAPRVASTMVCSDQFVLAMVAPENIVGVSAMGHDPQISALAERATKIASLRPNAETFLMTHTDIVVGAEHGDTKTLAMLERLGVTTMRVPSKNDLPAIVAQVAEVGHQLGVGDVGDKLAAEARQRLASVAEHLPARPVVAAYYRPDGGSSAKGTYVDAEMTAGGYRSLASELGQTGWGRLDLETLVMHPPEAMIISFFSFNKKSMSIGQRFAQHPVFREALKTVPVIAVPGAKTACGNWTLVEGVEFLAASRQTGGAP